MCQCVVTYFVHDVDSHNCKGLVIYTNNQFLYFFTAVVFEGLNNCEKTVTLHLCGASLAFSDLKLVSIQPFCYLN